MVEAAGVEPASGNLRQRRLHACSVVNFLAARFGRRKGLRARQLAKGLAHCLQAPAAGQPALNDIATHPAGRDTRRRGGS